MTIQQLAELEATCVANPNKWDHLFPQVGSVRFNNLRNGRPAWSAREFGASQEYDGRTLLSALRAMELATGVTL